MRPQEYGKPLVFMCHCGLVKKFGQFVRSELSIELIKTHYEVIYVLCENCSHGKKEAEICHLASIKADF